MRTGTANLPLHGGKCPAWLFARMKNLAAALIEIMVLENGTEEVLRRLADPFWFQAFGCVLGFDWHSSGLTTTVTGALKEALRDRAPDLGLFVCGGKGGTSRRTPDEIAAWGERSALTLDPGVLAFASRMAAKVDNAAVQDGYQLYHHVFAFSASGRWAVIQQGMNENTRYARRYHWLSEGLEDFVCEPHAAVCTVVPGETVLNLVARESDGARRVSAQLARLDPSRLCRDLARLQNDNHLELARHHRLLLSDLDPRSVEKVLLKSYAAQPPDFLALLGIQGVGPKAVRALSLMAELVYGAPASCRDPARFSFAHGGKDGHPYPIDRRVYDHSVACLERALAAARVGRTEKVSAFRRLARFQAEAPSPAAG
ncbi:MAG: DUF763 domain-containing protein [Bacillota bacterium]|nr:DUF763 domain-containing protein [Bacillota bacterium]